MDTSETSRAFAVGNGPQVMKAWEAPAPGSPGSRESQSARANRRGACARSALLPLCDGLALSAAALLVGPGWPAAGYVIAVLVALRACGAHRLRICMRISDEIPRLAACALVPLPILAPWMDSLGGFVLLGAVAASLLASARAGLYAALRGAHQANRLTEAVLIIGTGKLGTGLGELLMEHPELGMRPIGFVGSLPPDPDSPLPLLGGVRELPKLAAQHGVRRVFACFPARDDAELVSVLRAAQCPASVTLYVVPRMYELARAIPACHMDEVWGIPLLPVRRTVLQRLSGRAVKRGFDLLAGTVLLLALAPVMLVLVLAQLVSCGPPVLFRQERVTRSGRIMKIAKLRTVTCANPDSQWTVTADDCSVVGRWLRATHLDELPQLLNVIRGDMTLVGPRPERPYFTSQFAQIIPRYEDRHRTSAGMTGWAQVHGLTGDTSIAERVRFDNYYIEHWSFWLDLVILARTIVEPLSGALRARQGRRRPARDRP